MSSNVSLKLTVYDSGPVCCLQPSVRSLLSFDQKALGIVFKAMWPLVQFQGVSLGGVLTFFLAKTFSHSLFPLSELCVQKGVAFL